VALFDWIHSVDSPRLADALDRLAAELGRRPRVLVEVNTAGEASKEGVPPAGALALVEHVARLPHLELRGLMTVGPLVERADDARPAFQALARLLADAARGPAGDGGRLDTLSMGMSGDFEVAIEEGATMVRIGSALFGARAAQPGAH
jgi:pyridoxal phosphate enzyme (YggS family)